MYISTAGLDTKFISIHRRAIMTKKEHQREELNRINDTPSPNPRYTGLTTSRTAKVSLKRGWEIKTDHEACLIGSASCT